jgi:hypothetical protein
MSFEIRISQSAIRNCFALALLTVAPVAGATGASPIAFEVVLPPSATATGMCIKLVPTTELEKGRGVSLAPLVNRDTNSVGIALFLDRDKFKASEPIRFQMVFANLSERSVYLGVWCLSEQSLSAFYLTFYLIQVPDSISEQDLVRLCSASEIVEWKRFFLGNSVDQKNITFSGLYPYYFESGLNDPPGICPPGHYSYHSEGREIKNPRFAKEILSNTALVVEWPDVRRMFQISKRGRYAIYYDTYPFKDGLYSYTQRAYKQWEEYDGPGYYDKRRVIKWLFQSKTGVVLVDGSKTNLISIPRPRPVVFVVE